MAAFLAASQRDSWLGQGDHFTASAKAEISIRPLWARLSHLTFSVEHLAAERRHSDLACVRFALE